MSTNFHNPYFITYLNERVSLKPIQLDNNISKNLKDNLIKKVVGKCNRFGYVKKIYKIEEKSKGLIIPEDNSSSVFYDVKYLCKLCRPLNNTNIICRIVSINKHVILLNNGPIFVLILENQGELNNQKLTYDTNRGVYIANLGDGKGKILTAGMYVKVQIIGSSIEPTKIIAFGHLDSLASQEEIDEANKLEEDDDTDVIEYDEYMKMEEQKEYDEFVEDQESKDNEDEDENVSQEFSELSSDGEEV
jgi:DNA-directed RNA polymerase subunit E'/Rpb7